jgi:hypothetical protein
MILDRDWSFQTLISTKDDNDVNVNVGVAVPLIKEIMKMEERRMKKCVKMTFVWVSLLFACHGTSIK